MRSIPDANQQKYNITQENIVHRDLRKVVVLPVQKLKSISDTKPPECDITTDNEKYSECEAERIHSTSEQLSSSDIELRSTPIEKEKQKRIITSTKKWNFVEEDYTKANQMALLQSIQSENRESIDKRTTNHRTCVLQQLNQKIAGYKSQDILKDIYNPILFITIDRVIQLLIESELQCYYCKKEIKVLYEIVREPLQWTLDRIDNDHGHNIGNLLVACLSCNLRRKTIYHERYVMTKLCTNVIKLP